MFLSPEVSVRGSDL